MMDMKQEPLEPYIDEIKQEMLECEEPKLKQCSDLLLKIDHDFVRECEYLQNAPISIKEEHTVNDLYVDVNDIKQETFDFVQPKSESDLLTVLTSHCDLPTLKDESTAHPSYLDRPRKNKQSKRIFKTLKDGGIHVFKKRRRYPCPPGQNSFRSFRKTLFNAELRRFYETCYYCGHFFLTKSQFLSHFIVFHYVKKVKVHTGEKICWKNIGKKFEEKLFKCEICSKRFARKASLKVHLKIHTGEKSFNCEICSKLFTEKENLKDHLKIHTAEKPFKCEICSKQFTQKYYLNKHLIIHTGEKPFKCEMCWKQFARKISLTSHFKIHSGENLFKCEICSNQYTQKSSLKLHLKIHTADNPFKCDICSKEFTRKGYVKSHYLKMHTEEKQTVIKTEGPYKNI